MNDSIDISFDNGKSEYKPGEMLQGRVRWTLSDTPQKIELHLLWHTAGRGTEDIEIVDQLDVSSASSFGEMPFSFTLPLSPYSFSGSLISLLWAIELVVAKPDLVELKEFTLSPSGREIQLSLPAM